MTLRGKQLVFLFMAVTVVSVVIFLCGVLVGRGVQARTVAIDGPAPAAEAEPIGDEIGASTAQPPTDTPTPAVEPSFPTALTDSDPPAEKLVPRKEPPPAKTSAAAASTAPPSAPSTTAAPARAAEAPTPGIPLEPKGSGFAIQVAAFGGRNEAELVVKRLVGKGYAAFLVPPVAGAPSMYRVRVGKFRERTEAEKVAARLEREERFDPWITR